MVVFQYIKYFNEMKRGTYMNLCICMQKTSTVAENFVCLELVEDNYH